MLFVLRIGCFAPVICILLHLLLSSSCHSSVYEAISGMTGVAHGYCWETWQLYVHGSFRALSPSFFRPYLSSLPPVSRCLAFFFFYPLSHIISTCQAKGSRQMDGQLNAQIFRGAKKTMERWNEGVTARGWAWEKVEGERMKVRIQQGGPILKLLTYLRMT